MWPTTPSTEAATTMTENCGSNETHHFHLFSTHINNQLPHPTRKRKYYLSRFLFLSCCSAFSVILDHVVDIMISADTTRPRPPPPHYITKPRDSGFVGGCFTNTKHNRTLFRDFPPILFSSLQLLPLPQYHYHSLYRWIYEYI